MPPEISEILTGTSVLVILLICVSIVFSILLTIGVTIFAIRFIRKKFAPDPAILQNGISAQAKIINVRQTGTMVNYQPEIAFTLEVQPPNGPAYQAQTKAVIPMVNIPQFQPGTEVPVKIHPTDPTKIVLNIYG
ncbi:MAG: hypothetical protein JEZ06_24125 [Anaerolineaceae bacterium]|nr:hypothetical protein [Anaerolineaceae bacterium]